MHYDARRADRLLSDKGEEMNRPPIVAIELDIRGYALLTYEYTHANGKRLLQLPLAGDLPHLQIAFELFFHG